MPADLLDVVGHQFEQKALQHHTGTDSMKRGDRAAMFHGHGEGKDDEKPELDQYLRRVDEALLARIVDRRAPLLLAAVEHVAARYRNLSAHPRVLAETIAGNPSARTVEDLHERAWRIVSPLFEASRQEAIERFGALRARKEPQAAEDLETVLGAAVEGRIADLFVSSRPGPWGRFDPEAREIDPLEDGEKPRLDDDDLPDRAAAEALARGAAVHVLDPGEIPGSAEAAAILRY
jgi:hypothetical protein